MTDKKKMTINDINNKDFVLVEFWSPTCVPCRQMKSVLTCLEMNFPEFDCVYINVLENPELAQSLGVEKLPTIILKKLGVEHYRHNGVVGYDDLFGEMESILDAHYEGEYSDDDEDDEEDDDEDDEDDEE